MKKHFVAYYLFNLILVFSAAGLKSQDFPAVTSSETVQVCTDRTMYFRREGLSQPLFIENGNPA
jgi:hypothetical protein